MAREYLRRKSTKNTAQLSNIFKARALWHQNTANMGQEPESDVVRITDIQNKNKRLEKDLWNAIQWETGAKEAKQAEKEEWKG